MDELNEIVFRGHLDECLRYLGRIFNAQIAKRSKNVSKARQPMADFCGVSSETVKIWLDGNSALPIGEPHIKLMFYLDMLGYKVIELERMKKPRRNFAALIGFGLLSIEQAIQLVGYAKTSPLFKVLRGEENTSKGKESKMWNIWKEKKDSLERAMNEARVKYALPIKLIEERIPVTIQGAGPEIEIGAASRNSALVDIISGLSALLGREQTEEFIKSLDLASVRKIIRLAAQLNSLSTAINRARKGGA